MSVASKEGLASTVSPANSSTGSGKGMGSSVLGQSIFYNMMDSSSSPETSLATQRALETLRLKIEKTKQLISEQQQCNDENVKEYLKVSSNASRDQQTRIKAVFEKKNAKSAHTLAKLQRKLEHHHRRLQLLQEEGLPRSHVTMGGLGKHMRDMSSSVMAKPKELAAQLLLSKSHTDTTLLGGSADNLDSIKDAEHIRNHANKNSASLPRETSTSKKLENSSNNNNNSTNNNSSTSSSVKKRKCISDTGKSSERSASIITSATEDDEDEEEDEEEDDDDDDRVNGEHQLQQQELRNLFAEEFSLLREYVDSLRDELSELRRHFQSDMECLHEALREERDRYEHFEEQVNDLTELHQNEMDNLKSSISDMEEKVQYQSEERLLDLREQLTVVETKLTSLEHQQTQQQYLNIEGLDNTDARAVFVKLLTLVISVIHVALLIMGTLMNLVKPFVSSLPRFAATTALMAAFIVAWHHSKDNQLYLHNYFPLTQLFGTNNKAKS